MNALLALRRLYPSVAEHRSVEREVHRLLKDNLQEHYLRPVPAPPGTLRYASKNIFSILFLALYRGAGVQEKRRLLYGVLNHCVRGIVTAADNILDDEYKEMLPLRLSGTGNRFPSIMHILLFDRILFDILEEASVDGTIPVGAVRRVKKGIMDALVPIGDEEGSEEGGISEILHPDEILASVHMYKGGNLLRLAFVAPLLLEDEARAPLAEADAGIYRIGLALQVIDDLTDFHADLRDRRHNYLLSWVHHRGRRQERSALERILAGDDDSDITLSFPEAVRHVAGSAVGEALEGFRLLEKAGLPLSRRHAEHLIRALFRIRGVGELLPFVPRHPDTVLLREAA
ncbi:MAG TPA: hypothetical protein VNX25_06015 [Verrucomicrobiae bacterium]|nr:hypothetical protein [Verrucomicrobiae bacterium]